MVPLVDLPSESSTIAAGGGLPAAPGVAVRMRTAACTASPVAVPPLDFSRCRAAFTATRSVVGDCRTVAVWLNAITPTFTCLGTPSTNVVADRRAAMRREGLTSWACIEPLTSVMRRIEACSTGTATVVCGRAAAIRISASASANAAIGNPFGLDRTATEGIVSGLGRRIQAPNGFEIDQAIQTDAPINPGNSGGPLLDDSGRVIGVNSQIETGGSSSGNVGIGFAVPSNTVRQVVPVLEQGKSVEHAFLGVEAAADVNGGIAPAGAEIANVTPGGPAENAGIQPGDIIVAIDGKKVDAFDQVSAIVNAHKVGDQIDVRVDRGGGERSFHVKLGTRPKNAP